MNETKLFFAIIAILISHLFGREFEETSGLTQLSNGTGMITSFLMAIWIVTL